jgi:hypothetical protein
VIKDRTRIVKHILHRWLIRQLDQQRRNGGKGDDYVKEVPKTEKRSLRSLRAQCAPTQSRHMSQAPNRANGVIPAGFLARAFRRVCV